MLRIEKVRFNDGAGNAVVDIQVSTAAELPAIGETIGYSMKVKAGSIAQIIQTGDFVTLDDDGDWYDASGNVVGDD